MAILPARLLEWEFDAGVWTDVSADVVDYSTSRGRNRELGAFETGTGTFTLRNDGRKYDPDNTAGPYYGKLRPNRRLRFRATYNAVTYPVIVGYVDRITQQYGGPNDATVLVEISDLFKILNRAELPSSAYAAEVLTDAAALRWPLDEPSGTTSSREAITGAYPLVPFGGPTFGASSLAVRDPGTAVSFTLTTSGLQGVFAEGTWPWTTAGSLSWLYRYDGAGGSSPPMVNVAALVPSGPGIGLQANLNSISGNLEVAAGNNAAGSFATSSTGVDLRDGLVHHIAITFSAGSAIKIYIDGIDRTATVATFTGSMATTAYKWIAAINAVDYPPYVLGGGVATFDELALFTTALSAARAAAENTAARTPWNGDLPGTRLGRILDLAAVAAADRNLDAGTTTLQATSLNGSALGYAQQVEETDLGELFVTRDGKVRYVSRDALVTGAYLTSLTTLVDDDSGAGIPYRSVSSDVDESTIVTRSTVSREGSVAVTFYDAAAKAEFGWLDDTHEGLLHDSDAYSLAYAQWVVSTRKTPTSRIGTVGLELTGNPATMYPAILALELGDQVTYKRKPQNTGAVITLAMRVETISHDTGGGYWRARLQLSPFNRAGGVPVGVWDVSLWDQAVWGI